MSAFDYVETAQEAAAILSEFGALATVTATPAPLDDGPDTGQPPPVPVSVTAWATVFDYTDRLYGNQPDALIRAGDRQMLMAAIDVDGVAIPVSALPVDAPLIGPDGDAYIIKDPKPINPAGVVVLYDVRVRRP
jgi:hypothetical protein